jgi:serine/threonine protein kinase
LVNNEETKGKEYKDMAISSKLIKQAKRALKEGDYYRAGKRYEEIGDYTGALRAYELGEYYNEMGEIYEKLNEVSKAIEVYRKSRNFDKLIELYLKKKNIEAAGGILEDTNRFQEAAELYYTYGRYEKAAQIYEKRGLHQKAADSYEKAGNLKKAAVHFEKWFLSHADTSMGFQRSNQADEDLYKAVDLYIEVDEVERAFKLLVKNNKYEKAAKLALKLKKYEEAAKLFEKAQMLGQAADAYDKINQSKRACRLRGEVALSQGNKGEAAEWFKKGEDYIRAAEFFEWEQEYAKAAYCYYMIQNFTASASNYLKAGKEEEAARVFELDGEWREAADIYFKFKNYKKAGKLYEKAGDFLYAGLSFLEMKDDKRAMANFQQVNESSPHYERAVARIVEIFSRAGKSQLVTEKVEKLVKGKPMDQSNLEWYYILGQAYEDAGNFKKARDIFREILSQDHSFRDVHKKLEEVEALIKKFKEMYSVEENSARRYKILRKVGEGGMGIVYEAEDTKLKRMVALRVLDTRLIRDAIRLEHFYSEARSTAALSHSNIVKVYDVGQIEDDHFISMEFIEGERFFEIIRKKKPFPLSDIFFIAVRVLNALDYAHKKGVLHRDIRPHNIMLTRQKEIKVLDFGIAVIRDENSPVKSKGCIDFFYYMSPEQIRGEDIDYRSDIYSLGVTLFHMITGKAPFEGEGGRSIYFQHLFEPVPLINEFRQDIPEKLIEIVEKCMEKRKEDRYQHVQEILDEIKKIDTEPTSLEMEVEIPGRLEDEKEIIPHHEDLEDSVVSSQDEGFLITLSPGDDDLMEETIESRKVITEGRDFPPENSELPTEDNDLLEETIETSKRLLEGRDLPPEHRGHPTGDKDSLEETIESDKRMEE